MRRFTFISLLLVLAAVFVPSSYACECDGRGSPRQELRKSKAVFVGEVVGIEGGGRGTPYFIKFRVEEHWKGVKGGMITVSVPGGLCGIHFEVNQKWLVYAYGKNLETDNCRRTRLATMASDDLRMLGKAD